MNMNMNITNYYSSSIDWCEPNNKYSAYIVEYWNSYSSLFISLNGIVGIYYYPKLRILYYTLIPIGISSFYFHATLSLLGQLLDEFFIIYSIIIALHYVNNKIYIFCRPNYLLTINCIQIFLMFAFPIYNRLFLFIYGFYCVKIFQYIKKNSDIIAVKNIIIAEKLFICSFICWIIDYMCIFSFNFHSLWHIVIGMVGFYVFKSFDTTNNILLINKL